MKKSTAFVLVALGGAAVGHAAYEQSTRYSNDAIWGRLKPAIEMHYRRNPEQRKLMYSQLRDVLKQMPQGDAEKRCRFEKLFVATAATGSAELGQKAIESRSYEPYAECKPGSQLEETAKKGYAIAGAVAFLAGAVSLIVSLFKKKEGSPA